MSIEQPDLQRRDSDQVTEDDRETQVLEPLLPMPELEDGGPIESYVLEHSEAAYEGARETVVEILKIVKEDEQAVKLINETLESLFRYIETIYYLEVNVKMLSLRWEGQELQEKVERHDARRRRAHDALIANLISTTRYLNTNFTGKVPQTGIYNGNEQDLVEPNRIAIGDWAIELEHEILLARSK